MSGGHFNYRENQIEDTASEIDELIAMNDSETLDNDLVRICEGGCDEHGEDVRSVHVYHGDHDWGEFHYCPAAIDRDTINGMDVVVDGEEDRRTLQAWNQLWPRTDFKDRETWLSYCRKWWPKTPELVEILDAHARQPQKLVGQSQQ